SGLGDVAVRVEARRHVADCFLEMDDVRQELVVDLDEAERLDRRLLVVRGYGGALVTDETDLFAEDRFLAPERRLRRIEAVKDGSYARQLLSLLRVYPAHARARIRAPQHTRVEHAGQVHVLRVPRTARYTLLAVHPSARPLYLGAC